MAEKWTLETAATEKAPGLHPLAGARLSVFLRHALFTPGLDPRTRYQRFIASVGQFLRFPSMLVETVQYSAIIHRHPVETPPVFIIGHWRSGTTHLHNLMCRDPQFGYMKFAETAMPLNMLGLIARAVTRLIDRALPEDRGFDKVRLTLEEPQEEEMGLGNLNPVGYYNIYYFPHEAERHRDRSLFFEGLTEKERATFRKNYEFLVKKVSYVKNGKQLLFKNPPSTCRIPMILEMFPNAKFVHIVRNPWEVYSSTCSHFARVFNAFAWQSFQDFDIRGYTLDTYGKLMSGYLADRDKLDLPANQLVETTYEAIASDPLGELGNIYDALGISAKDEGLQHIDEYLGTLEGYRTNAHSITSAEAKDVKERWKFAFDAWGYDPKPPASIEIT